MLSLNMLKYVLLGLALVLNPCTYFLLPVILLTINKAKNQSKAIILFLLGFVASFLLLGVLGNVLQNFNYFNSIKITIALFLIAFGIYSFYKPNLELHINLKPISMFSIGLSIPFLTSASGCGLPVALSAITSILISKHPIISAFSLFIGMITPYLLVFMFQKSFLNLLQKHLQKLNKTFHLLTPFLLIIVGLYTLFTVFYISITEIKLLFAVLFIIFAILCFIKCNKTPKKRLITLLLLATITYILWIVVIYTCQLFTQQHITGPIESLSILKPYINQNAHTCNAQVSYCPYCITCNLFFIITTVITAYVYIKSETKPN